MKMPERNRDAVSVPDMLLSDGRTMPMIAYGLGSANMSLAHEEVVKATRMAIENGYYHLDGAEAYGNEQALGQAVRESGVPRDKFFITTKVLGSPGQHIQASFDSSLQKLGLDYVDLFLIHLPYLAPNEVPSMWKAMESIKRSGKALSIGVSNFLQEHLESILKEATIPPAINQIEYHPYLQHGNLVKFCQENGIAVSAYKTLTAITTAAPGPVDGIYTMLAKRHSVTPGDIAMRWCIDQTIAVVTTSSSAKRLQSWLQNIFTIELSEEEIGQVSNEGMKKHYRGLYQRYFKESDKR
ncbi:Aldo/keto reductase [Nemania sp. FL0031]|nr:Aldo/keto reductase [Nemania sp. FL0031]